MRKKNSWLVWVTMFVLMAFLAVGLGYYRDSLARERTMFKISLPQKKEKTITIDLAKQGLPKYLVQPERIMIRTSRKGILNCSTDTIHLVVKTANFPGKVQVQANNQTIPIEKGYSLKPLSSHKACSLFLDLTLDKKQLNKYLIGTGEIIFWDAQKKKSLGHISVKIINSYKRMGGKA